MRGKIITLICLISFISINLNGQDYISIYGNIKDSKTINPLELVHVYSLKYKLGSISNSIGDFIIKLPIEAKGDTLILSHIAYDIKSIIIPKSDSSYLDIFLTKIPQNLKEVVITGITVERIIDSMISHVQDNYSQTPAVLRGFMREEVTFLTEPILSLSGTSIKEAVFDIYKHPYLKCWKRKRLDDEGRIIAYKNIQSNDSIDIPLFGISFTSLINQDILRKIKNTFLIEETSKTQYNFKLLGLFSYVYGKAYVIEFDQKDGIEKQLKKGRIIIDAKSFALVLYEESLSTKGQDYRIESPFPLGKIKNLKYSKRIQYGKIDDKWFLYYVEYYTSSIITMTNQGMAKTFYKEEFKEIDTIFQTITFKYKFIITDYNDHGISKFKNNEKFKMLDYQYEGIKENDIKLWKDYNYISPSDISLKRQ